MGCNYDGIRTENIGRYGTEIKRIGRMLLADRYDKRTHFIFELLQNAEDALRRRVGWQGSRAVTFDLSDTQLKVSHYGQPFNEPDVRGVSGIGESTKDITSIGHFGIGFKSVYAFTDRPEIHSGDEDFAIESYVWPYAVEPIQRDPESTVLSIPFRHTDSKAHGEIIAGLRELGPRTLLFLREASEIVWQVDGGPSGLYRRAEPCWLDQHVRQVTVFSEENGASQVQETWLIFSRDAYHNGKFAGRIEIAFSLLESPDKRQSISPITGSPLVVFFPTILETHLGFLVQGPYQTTPSRDNIPRDLAWNQHVVTETGALIVDSLRWLRARGWLDLGVLQSLPLNSDKLRGHLLAPLFGIVKNLLTTEDLLPAYDGGYVSAAKARLARTQDVRALFSAEQLGKLLEESEPIHWLSSDITQDRAHSLRQYLMSQLGISEIVPDTIVGRLSSSFLEEQPDEWIQKLYEFLNTQPALLRRLASVPIVRLEGGRHVSAMRGDKLQVFLPGDQDTELPTVRRTVIQTEGARRFLASIGLNKPDPVDDVIRNVLPRFDARRGVSVTYDADFRRILLAYKTDSNVQRDKLVAALRQTPFVAALDAASESKSLSLPGSVYIPSERLRTLFAGVEGVLLVDDSGECLRGDDVRGLLEACGSIRYIAPTPSSEYQFSDTELRELRRSAGCEKCSRGISLVNYDLRGLKGLLHLLPELSLEDQKQKAALLWDALVELSDRRRSVFSGEYKWFFVQPWSTRFDAAFVTKLNSTAWIPDDSGSLRRPDQVLFESLGWESDPFLLTKIRFKPPVVDALAREAGIEPGVLELLKRLGLTSVTELEARLNVENGTRGAPDLERDDGERGKHITHDDGNHHGPAEDTWDSRAKAKDSWHGRDTYARTEDNGKPYEYGARPADHNDRDSKEENRKQRERQPPDGTSPRRFISYVTVEPNDEGDDPDGLEHSARMALESKAIERILKVECHLRRTKPGNEGFDLIQEDLAGDPERWIEVKAMLGSFESRPVGMSRTQFDYARRCGDQYWLYIVEYTNDDARARITKIRDPAGKAGTFTFDYGWRAVAENTMSEPRHDMLKENT